MRGAESLYSWCMATVMKVEIHRVATHSFRLSRSRSAYLRHNQAHEVDTPALLPLALSRARFELGFGRAGSSHNPNLSSPQAQYTGRFPLVMEAH